MLKDFLNRLLELKKPEMIKDEFDREYMISGYGPVKLSLKPSFNTHSLVSIVDYIKQNFDNCDEESFVIHVLDHERVNLKSVTFGEFEQRELLVVAEASNPDFRFGTFYDQENFIISLMTKFVETEGSAYALGVAAGIVEGEEAKLIDDGMSQRVVMKKGITTVEENEVTPYVNLQPYRTFREINQPKSMFLLRLREGAKLAIFEADGGAWKQEAIQNIVAYFKTELDDDSYSILY